MNVTSAVQPRQARRYRTKFPAQFSSRLQRRIAGAFTAAVMASASIREHFRNRKRGHWLIMYYTYLTSIPNGVTERRLIFDSRWTLDAAWSSIGLTNSPLRSLLPLLPLIPTSPASLLTIDVEDLTSVRSTGKQKTPQP